MLQEPLMNVHEIFFMRHTAISLKEDKMYQTCRGIPGFNFRTSCIYSADLNFNSLVGS